MRWNYRVDLVGQLLLVLFFLSWPGTATLTGEEAAIYEAVFRHQFIHSGQGLDSLQAFCLVVQDQNPPDEFLARFASHRPPVRRGSDYGPDAGIQFAVGRIEWLDAGKVKVYAGSYCSSWQATRGLSFTPASAHAQDIYVLTRSESGWVVEHVENIMIE
jgi:hypothetical protein